MNDNVSSVLHFKFYRLIKYISFYPHYIFCKLFHKQESMWQSWKGAMVCDCGYIEDLGMCYGMHCEECYNRVNYETQKRIEQLNKKDKSV